MSTRVYLGGLSHRCRERDIERFFRKFGRLREISLKNGFAFCEFDDYRDADDACYELNGKEFMGERVVVEIARGTPHGRDKDRWGTGGGGGGRRSRSPPRRGRQFTRDSRGRPVWLDKYGPPTRTDYRLIIENLSSRVSWQDLKDYMRQAGDVTYADAHKTRRNEGCVEFANAADLKTALDKLDGTELNGRKIRLIEDKRSSKKSRSRSASRSRSRSRSRNRSRSRSRSGSRTRHKSRSVSRGRKSRSASRGRGKSRSASRGRDKSRSPSRGRKSRSRSRSKSRGRSRSRERRSRSRSRSRSSGRRRSRSRSSGRRRSRSRSGGDRRSKSRERNGTSEKRSASRSRSRSRSNSFRSRSRSGSRGKDRRAADDEDEPMNESRGDHGSDAAADDREGGKNAAEADFEKNGDEDN